MDVATRTLAVTLPVSDAGFLRKQAGRMGWQVVAVPARKRTPSLPKTEMTEQEFRAKLAHSSTQGAAGQYIEMQPNETAEQFINRILCTQSV